MSNYYQIDYLLDLLKQKSSIILLSAIWTPKQCSFLQCVYIFPAHVICLFVHKPVGKVHINQVADTLARYQALHTESTISIIINTSIFEKNSYAKFKLKS